LNKKNPTTSVIEIEEVEEVEEFTNANEKDHD
jgi:hypothetical protein